MAQSPVPNVMKLVVTWANGSEEFSNGFHFQKIGFNEADLLAAAQAADAWFSVANMANWSNELEYKNVTAYDLQSDTGPVKVVSTNTRYGGGGTNLLPIQVALVVTVRTSARGKSGRGRQYIGGMTEEDFDADVFSAAAEARALTYVDAIVTAVEALGWTYGILQRYQDHVQLGTPVFREAIERSVRNRQAGTQRRRSDRP